MRVLACDKLHEDGLAMLLEAGFRVVVSNPIKDPTTRVTALNDVGVILVRSATKVDAGAIAGASKLKVTVRAGAGVDTIDVDAAAERGIAVMNAPDGNTLAAGTPDLLFALARHIPKADAGMKTGQWPKIGHEDRPGIAGLVGSEHDAAGVHIVNFSLGATGDRRALAAITVDRRVEERELASMGGRPGVLSIEVL